MNLGETKDSFRLAGLFTHIHGTSLVSTVARTEENLFRTALETLSGTRAIASGQDEV